MKRITSLVMLATAAACSTVPVEKVNGPMPVASGSLDLFEPLVAPSSASPTCEVVRDRSLAAGQRAVALVFHDTPGRQVTVTLDEEGTPIRYMDVRGDLASPDVSRGDRTTIGLYLDGGYAVLSNRQDGSPPTLMEVPLADALASDRLGRPSESMERVLSTCAEEAAPQS